ncbi:MAG: lamin tail domain-containing protein [Anaerolineales bacterium]
MEKNVHAAPEKNPAQENVPSNTPSTPTITLTLTPTLTDTSTATPTLTATSLHTATPTRIAPPTRTPGAPDHIVISEFRTLGPLGADDEFIELYNPTGAPVNIGGWRIKTSSACGNNVTDLVTILSYIILQPGQHYLLASLNNSLPFTIPPDQTFWPGIDNTGGIALVSSTGSIVDQVGMCAGTYYHAGTTLPPLPVAPLFGTPTPIPGTSDQSYERKPGGDTACYDTGNNANDFVLISPANPKNQSSASVLCAGVHLSTPTITPTPTATPTHTPLPYPTTIPGVVVLNEFLPHPRTDWNSDGTINFGDQYIEIINLDASAINVKNWKLDTDVGSMAFSLPDLTLQPRQIAAFFGSHTGIVLSDGGATLRLLKPDGSISDAFTYPVVEAADQAWCRLPDGTGVWGFACRPSPGLPNITIHANTSGPGLTLGENSICNLVNTVPQPFILAECGSFGAGISDDLGEKVFWLQSRWKWAVFVK